MEKEEIKNYYPTLEYSNNLTTSVLLPAINVGNISSIKIQRNLTPVESPYQIFREFGFLGIFCYRINRQYEPDKLYGLFNPKEFIYLRWFSMLPEYLKEVNINGYCPLDSYEEIEKGIFVFNFNIHRRYEGIKDIFLTSKYSRINLLYPNYVDFFEGDSKVYKALIKSVKLRREIEDRIGVELDKDAELLDSIEVDKETLKY